MMSIFFFFCEHASSSIALTNTAHSVIVSVVSLGWFVWCCSWFFSVFHLEVEQKKKAKQKFMSLELVGEATEIHFGL